MILSQDRIEKTCHGCKHYFNCVIGNVHKCDGKATGDVITFCEFMFRDRILKQPTAWHLPEIPKGLCPKGGLLSEELKREPIYSNIDIAPNYTICAEFEFDSTDSQVIYAPAEYDKGDDSLKPDNIDTVLWWLDLDFFEKRRRTSIVTTDLVYEMLEL